LIATISPTSATSASPITGQLPTIERNQLTEARAFTTDPVRFFLIGDSQALTLGEGLRIDSKRRFGVDLINGAVLGCDLDPGSEILESGFITHSSTNCRDWESIWPSYVRKDHVSVVGLLVARWEEYDHLYDGHWTHLGEALWDHHIERQLDTAVQVLANAGATVVLFTAPYVNPPNEAANGQPFPENSPARVKAYNAIVNRVVASHAKDSVVLNLKALLDPRGVYASTIRGVQVRSTDGIHITDAGGVQLQPSILPTIAEVGLARRRIQR
jgi:hypothetical protein